MSVEPSGGRRPRSFLQVLTDYNVVFMLVVLVGISSILSDKFFTQRNILNICNQLSAPTVIAIGMLMVILIGGIDLSVGAVAAVGSVVVATLCFRMGLLPAILLTLGIGLAMGLTTGLLASYGKIAPFIASLAMQTIGVGIAFIVSNGSPIIPPLNQLDDLGSLRFGPISAVMLIAAAVVLIFTFVQNFTPYGRIVMAIGSNESVVHLAGIRAQLYKMSVFGISGFLSALGGIIIAARTAIGSPLVGNGMELDAIAAAVIGGASLSGGKGTVVRTLGGVICLGLINNVMNLMGIPSYPQAIVKGVIIIFAVILQRVTGRA